MSLLPAVFFSKHQLPPVLVQQFLAAGAFAPASFPSDRAESRRVLWVAVCYVSSLSILCQLECQTCRVEVDRI